MAKAFFDKFVAPKNSAVKEKHKQAKRKAKKERAKAIDQRFEDKRRQKQAAREAADAVKHSSGAKLHPSAVGKPTPGKSAAAPLAKPTGKAPVEKVPLGKPVHQKAEPATKIDQMPLNKFLAHCGLCSRRDAVILIKDGKIKVNGTVVLEPAHKVSETDEVEFGGKKLFVTKNLVYILLNKPKDYITTTDDPQGRKTVLQLIKAATHERVYPIGRLDRNTSGVLLLTNDGELTQKLSHPSYQITKVYEAKLDKELTRADFDKILNGITLEDGDIKADSLAYADSRDKSVIGIEIHSGRNRIVRRIFEHLGYDVKALDRVMFANLTKKNVERGKWRFLAEKEVRLLKYMNASLKKPATKVVKKS